LEQRALDAWSDGRLMVKLDHGIAPVGLRDLPAIDASFEAQREHSSGWRLPTPSARNSGRPLDGPVARQVSRRARRKKAPSSGLRLSCRLLALPGLAGACRDDLDLARQSHRTDAGRPGAELRAGIDGFGTRYGLPSGVTEWLFLLSIISDVCSLRFAREPPRQTVRKARAQGRGAIALRKPIAVGDAVFVSYARANQGVVLPVIEAAKQLRASASGSISKGLLQAMAGLAKLCARSASPRVVVMCSQAAFESDHVKREIYLADRYQKRLVPVLIEQAEPPEDFEYFFAGVQMLKLFETPEAERPQALAQALGAKNDPRPRSRPARSVA
jgi:hypothetical protein